MVISTEINRRIWDDDNGVYIEIRPDQDGLGTIEIHTPDEKSKKWFGDFRFSVTKEVAKHLGEALISASKEIE